MGVDGWKMLALLIIADGAKHLKLGEDWTMEVTDEVGLVLFRLDSHIAASAAIMGCDRREVMPA